MRVLLQKNSAPLQPLSQDLHHLHADFRALLEQIQKHLSRDFQGYHPIFGLHCCGPPPVAQNCDLSQKAVAAHGPQPHRMAIQGREPDLGLPLSDDVDGVGGIPLLYDNLSGLEMDNLGGVGDQLESGGGQAGEQRNVSQHLDIAVQVLHDRILHYAVVSVLAMK